MRDKYGTGPDPYCYPGTTVLRNLLNLTDEDALSNAERDLSAAALDEIEFELPPYDLSYMSRIHLKLFGEVYQWAGELRTVDISKQDTRFCTVGRIEPEAARLFRGLAARNWFEGMARAQLVPAVADFYGEVNMIHPFREGNGRAQRVLFEHIIINAGFQIDWWEVDTPDWIPANIAAAFGDPLPLTEIFEHCIGGQLLGM
ncbi:Fic family protein [Pseudomonas sp. SO81]|uniref:Fic/DOC family protein n=1 Tax=Pseudomonas sp. SO81 TaxID=2983246 RepID=UPI0025A43D71|nr:Fic family protein [Pseudomonas sp. SO81]WJN58670.1 Cell filamentation protein fic [Pseudomonas sp. SO81]